MKGRLVGAILVISTILLATPVTRGVANEEPITVRRNLDYAGQNEADADRRKLDVYTPASGNGHPLVFWIHGGGWRKGDKDRVGAKPKLLCDKSFVLVSVGYRLVPEVGYREQAGDIAQAIGFARQQASQWGADPDRVYLMGHSAGAHLAALVATDQRYLLSHSVPPDSLAGVIPVDGAGYDIPTHMLSAGPVAQRLYAGVFGNSAAEQGSDGLPRHQSEVLPLGMTH